jgi:hypothetical protein
METKNKKTSREWQKERQRSYTRFRWQDFEEVELSSSRNLIDNIEASAFLDKYYDSEYLYVIDIFPLCVSAESLIFEDVEQYFLKTEPNNFTGKFTKIILKLCCYYPYTNVIVSHSGFILDHEESNYSKPLEYFDIVMSQIIVEETENFINTAFDNLGNSSVSFYFKSANALITLGSGCFDSVIRMLGKNDEFIDLLRILVISEGLFLRK